MDKILITGSSSGIGYALTKEYIKSGNKVVGISSRNIDVSEFENSYEHHQIDLSNIKELETDFKKISKSHKDINIIICNAGKGIFKELDQLSVDEISEMINLNLTSHIILLKSFLKNLRKQKNAKVIIIGSEAGLNGAKKSTIYSATKFALRGLQQSLNKELAKNNIPVTIINPGMVKTAFYNKLSFTHGPEKSNYIDPKDIVSLIKIISQLSSGCNIEEINLKPFKKLISYKD